MDENRHREWAKINCLARFVVRSSRESHGIGIEVVAEGRIRPRIVESKLPPRVVVEAVAKGPWIR
jgi:hypothetical protein